MSTMQIAGDRWTCVGAARVRRWWHSRWLGGTGRAPHRWVATAAESQPLTISGGTAIRATLVCAACGLPDEVTHVSLPALLASRIPLSPAVRATLGLPSAAPPPAEPPTRRDGGPIVFRVAPSNIILDPASPKRARSLLGDALVAAWSVGIVAGLAIGRGLRATVVSAWRVATWPVRTAWRVGTAPARAVASWWRWAKADLESRVAFPAVLTGVVVGILGVAASAAYRDYTKCRTPKHTGVVEAIEPLVDSEKQLVRFVGGLEYRAQARREDPVLKPGLRGYVCEKGHFHYQPAPADATPPAAATTKSEDF